MLDHSDEPGPAQRAFVASDSHTFLGQKMKGFCIMRQIAAQAMGNRWISGRVHGMESSLCRECQGRGGACAKCKGSGVVWSAYDGMFADVVALHFLCMSPNDETRRAISHPTDVLSSAIDWAVRQSISIGSSAYQEACANYWAIIQEIKVSQFEAGESDEAGGSSPNG